MRCLPLALILAILAPASALAETLTVNLDQAARLTLSRPAGDVMVGNAAIADVSVLDPHHLILTGKSFGVTNLMVIDQTGRVIFNRQVVVGANDANRVSLYRGPNMYTYACSHRCDRTPAAVQGQ